MTVSDRFIPYFNLNKTDIKFMYIKKLFCIDQLLHLVNLSQYLMFYLKIQ